MIFCFVSKKYSSLQIHSLPDGHSVLNPRYNFFSVAGENLVILFQMKCHFSSEIYLVDSDSEWISGGEYLGAKSAITESASKRIQLIIGIREALFSSILSIRTTLAFCNNLYSEVKNDSRLFFSCLVFPSSVSDLPLMIRVQSSFNCAAIKTLSPALSCKVFYK